MEAEFIIKDLSSYVYRLDDEHKDHDIISEGRLFAKEETSLDHANQLGYTVIAAMLTKIDK